MRALILLEAALVKNNALRILRSPLRSALWISYIGVLLTATVFRMHAPASRSTSSLLSAPLASAFGGSYLVVFGVSTAYHALGNVNAFRSRAEALLFSNAGLSARRITIWLQACKLFALTSRWFWTILLNFVIFSPSNLARGELLRSFGVSIAGAGLLIAIEIPAFLLGRMRFGPLLTIGCVLTAIVGLAYMLLGLGAAGANRISAHLLRVLPFDPGTAVVALLHGPPAGLTFFFLAPLLVSFTLIPLGADAAPELYAASIRSFALFKRNRSATLGAVFQSDRKNRKQGRAPSGSFVLLWKEWLGFRRRRWALFTWIAMLASAIGTASFLAIVARMTHHETDAWLILGLLLSFVFIVPLFASIGLADDVGKPLFWMTTRSLRARLLVWTCARSWRGALIVDVALLVASIGMGDIKAVLPATATATTLWFSLNAMGVLIYALFPNRFDGYGPLFFIRLIAAVALLLPGVFVALCAALLKQHIPGIASCVCLTLALEALASLEIAVRLLRRESSGYATAE